MTPTYPIKFVFHGPLDDQALAEFERALVRRIQELGLEARLTVWDRMGMGEVFGGREAERLALGKWLEKAARIVEVGLFAVHPVVAVDRAA